MNLEQFYKVIETFEQKYENRDLETYLLALLNLVEEHKTQQMSIELLLHLLEAAFVAEPKAFDPAWLQIEGSPDESIFAVKFTNPELNLPNISSSDLPQQTGLAYTIDVLQFQISDLYKMRGKQLENEYKYFGVISETGSDWYNFDPISCLKCGTACLMDHDLAELDVSWRLLGELLEMGRVYE